MNYITGGLPDKLAATTITHSHLQAWAAYNEMYKNK